MPGGAQARGADRKDELLDAAWDLVVRDGLAACTYRGVAGAVGTSTNPVIRQFPTRQDLLAALFERLSRDFDSAREEAVTTTDPVEAVLAEGREVLSDAGPSRARSRISLELAFHSLRDPVMRRAVRARDRDRGARWTAGVETGQERGLVRPDRPAAEIVDQLGALLDGLAFANLAYPARLPRPHVRMLWEDGAVRLMDPGVGPGVHQRLVVPERRAPRLAGTGDSEGRRERLLGVAFRVTARDGLEGLSFRTLAAEAGTSTSPFTSAFGSREQLLAEMVGAIWASDPEVVRAASRIPGPVDRFFAEWATELSDDPAQVDRDRVYYELHHAALTDPELARLVREGDADGFDVALPLVEAGREEGTVRSDIPVSDLVDGLFALVDGLGLRRILLTEKRPAGYRIGLWEDGGRRMLAP